LARQLVQRGHQVYVLTAMPNYPQGRIYPGYGGFLMIERGNNIVIIRTFIYATKSTKLTWRLISYFSFVLSSLIFGMWKFPFLDFLITESPPLFLGFAGYFLSRMKQARWIFNVSDLWPASAVHLGLVSEGSISLQLAYQLESFCYKNAWLVTGQSKEILSDIKYRFPFVKTYHLSNGVDTDIFCPEKRSPELRRQLSWEDKCVAIYAGLHGIAQGLEQILEAASRLRNSKLIIVFVGDGPQKEMLIQKAKKLNLKNVYFMDPQPHAKMPMLLASADIALVSLKKRLPGAIPSKLYEAMGAGLPVILIAEGEPANIVLETKSGVVVSPGDIEGLVSALQDLAEDPDKRNLLGFNGRKAALTYFNRKVINNNFIQFLEVNL